MPKRIDNDGLTSPKKQRSKDYHCTVCTRDYVEDSFYNSNSILSIGNNNKLWICKKCVVDLYNKLFNKYDDAIFSVFRMCQLLDIYFEEGLAKSLETQTINTNTSLIKLYIGKVNSLPQYSDKTFADSVQQSMKIKNSINQNEFNELDEKDIVNMNEVISLVGYDPFEDSNIEERPYLYNTILNYLDENTINDSFKLSAVIQITKMYSQLDIMDNMISNLTRDIDNLDSQSGKLKQLMEIKRILTSQIMSFAKENRITASKQDGSSKGTDTFSGKLKELREKKIRPSDTNLFDINTSKAFEEIAKISNQSIAKQLMFDENDYTKMIKMQKEKMQEYLSKYNNLNEELRLVKVENEYLKKENIKLKEK